MNFLMGQTYGLLFDLIKLDLNKTFPTFRTIAR